MGFLGNGRRQEQVPTFGITIPCLLNCPRLTRHLPPASAYATKLGPSRCEDMMKLTHKFAEMTPEKRPQDPYMDGTGLRFETMEHGGEYPDTMPRLSS